jgi:hypothetical protein
MTILVGCISDPGPHGSALDLRPGSAFGIRKKLDPKSRCFPQISLENKICYDIGQLQLENLADKKVNNLYEIGGLFGGSSIPIEHTNL